MKTEITYRMLKSYKKRERLLVPLYDNVEVCELEMRECTIENGTLFFCL